MGAVFIVGSVVKFSHVHYNILPHGKHIDFRHLRERKIEFAWVSDFKNYFQAAPESFLQTIVEKSAEKAKV
jgi:hypothetical protein